MRLIQDKQRVGFVRAFLLFVSIRMQIPYPYDHRELPAVYLPHPTTMATQTVSRGFSLAARQMTASVRSANVLSSASNRFMFQGNRAWFSSYPPHLLVGMPSLSPVRKA
jgi:hypothetical protein